MGRAGSGRKRIGPAHSRLLSGPWQRRQFTDCTDFDKLPGYQCSDGPPYKMSKQQVDNLNIASQKTLIPPREIKAKLPLSDRAREVVSEGRQTIRDILDGNDHRLFMVVGPCSIHDPEAAMEYARRLRTLADQVSDTLYLVLRVYFEKPRSTVGWKGLINDPRMDDSFHVEEGLHLARKLLLDVAETGLAAATEALDPITPQYLQDLISWSAIGARTTESQTHREMSSGLSSPVGFKNGTDGSLEVATNAMLSVQHPHHFLGIDPDGKVAITTTRGNPYAHVVLRGGGGKPNYDSVSVKLAEEALEAAGVSTNIMVDCSHANSNKDPSLQPLVMENVTNQILEGNRSIVGLMVESNLEHGKQKIPDNLSELKYGVSVTDGCIGWDETEKAVLEMAKRLREALPARQRKAA